MESKPRSRKILKLETLQVPPSQQSTVGEIVLDNEAKTHPLQS